MLICIHATCMRYVNDTTVLFAVVVNVCQCYHVQVNLALVLAGLVLPTLV